MHDLWLALARAVGLIWSADPDVMEIIGLSFRVSLTAVAIACVIGLPLGALLAVKRFPGRSLLIAAVNAGIGLPTVAVGLVVYLLLSRSGPFGSAGMLFTPSAMVIAQTVVVVPIVAAFARQTLDDLHRQYDEQLRSFCVRPTDAVLTLLWEGRFSLLTAVLAGFGRAISEVGTVLVVGGNINHYTRVMTTTIALETSKGDLPLAVALGIILIALTLVVNVVAQWIRDASFQAYG